MGASVEIISRPEARAAGLKRYFTGNPCPSGHVSERYVSTCACVECIVSKKALWNAANKDRIKEYSKEYSKNHPEKSSSWRAANRERSRELSRSYGTRVAAWKKVNRERYNARQVERRRERLKVDPVTIRARELAHVRKRQAKWRMPSWANEAAIRDIYVKAKQLSKESGEKLHVDHIVPLLGKDVCGLHVEDNLRIIDAHSNMSKNNRFDPSCESLV